MKRKWCRYVAEINGGHNENNQKPQSNYHELNNWSAWTQCAQNLAGAFWLAECPQTKCQQTGDNAETDGEIVAAKRDDDEWNKDSREQQSKRYVG